MNLLNRWLSLLRTWLGLGDPSDDHPTPSHGWLLLDSDEVVARRKGAAPTAGAAETGPAAPDVLLSDRFPLTRFHAATLAFFRAKQLDAGARPRVDGAGHCTWRVALLEVEAAQVSWYLE